MVAVRIARPTTSKTMSVITPDGRRVSMYSTPGQLEYGAVAVFGQQEREGYKAITRKTADGLAVLSFTSSIFSVDYTQSIESVARALVALGRAGTRVRFNAGSPEFEQALWWNIKDLKVSVTQRAADNSASRITLSWSLEEAVDANVAISAIPKPPPPPAPAKPVGAATRTHRVVSGDTLWGIANRYLNNQGWRWPEIYNINKGVVGGNPNYILPGQLLKVPA